MNPSADQSEAAGLQILVVDDEPSVRCGIQMLLKHDGHMVSLADSGEHALTKLEERKFDLVITDYSMPGMRGDELASRIRQRIPRQPIIMASAFIDERRLGASTHHVNAVLPKPFSREDLQQAVNQALQAGIAPS